MKERAAVCVTTREAIPSEILQEMKERLDREMRKRQNDIKCGGFRNSGYITIHKRPWI